MYLLAQGRLFLLMLVLGLASFAAGYLYECAACRTFFQLAGVAVLGAALWKLSAAAEDVAVLRDQAGQAKKG